MAMWSQVCRVLVTGAVATACAPGEELSVGPGEPEDTIGKADGSDEVRAEVKLTIDPSSIRRARSRLALYNADSEERGISFYDSWALAGLDAGLILRAREIRGDDDDSTVKLRPLAAEDVDASWFDVEGFKCEIDHLVAGETPTCSLTVVQDEDEIDDVADGVRGIDKLFSAEQEQLLAEYGPGLGWDDLVALGPIEARVWTVATDALPAKLTAELWYMPDGTQVLEVSMKVPVDEADDGEAELSDWLAGRGLALATEQETKTRRALESLTRR
jgi:hypothetical protein